MVKIKRGTFILWGDWESLDEALGSYPVEELKNGNERIVGFASIQKAQEFSQKIDEEKWGFKILNSQMKVVYMMDSQGKVFTGEMNLNS